MAEKPILFNGEMVRAILDGRKTQTRRPIKHVHFPDGTAGVSYPMRPKYRQGDLLYVRESYAPNYFGFGKHAYRADWTSEAADVVPEPKWTPSIHMRKSDARIWLRVTDVRLDRTMAVAARDEFRRVWDAAYPGSWDRDDWVWVYEFERVEAPNA